MASTSIVKPNLQLVGHHLEAYQAAVDTALGQAQSDINSLLQGGVAGTAPVHMVRAATTGALAANTYAGAGQTLTANANGALASQDGVALNVGDRVLVTAEATASNNGIYTVTALGGASAKYVLTRAGDFNASADVQPGVAISVSEGTANAGTSWMLTTAAPITLDTTGLTFAKYYEFPGSIQMGISRTARVVATSALAAYTRTGLVITANANGALAAVDGVTLNAGDRLLLTAGAAGSDNGIYVVTQVGTGGTPFILTMAQDYQQGLVVPQLDVAVSEGTTHANSCWFITTSGAITVGTTATTWSRFAQDPGAGTVGQLLAITSTGVAGYQAPPPYFRARNVVITNVATLSAFTGVTGGAANNGVTCVQGDNVLLVNQTTAAQNGLYQVGVVSAGTAPLTRVGGVANGQTIIPDTIVQVGSEPTVGKNTQWRASCANGLVYNTNDPLFVCDLGNFIDMMSTTTGTSGATPTNYFFAGCVLVAKTTGIFEVDIDVDFSSDTTAQPITMVFLTDTSASGALGGANNVAHGISGVTAGIGTQAGAGATVDTNGGATMTYNAAGWSTAPITHKTKVTGTFTGLLTTNGSGTFSFSFKGKVFNAAETGTTKTPFTIGNSVGFGLKASAGGGTISFPNVKMSVKEVPAG